MTYLDIAHQRLQNQGISQRPFTTPHDVVARLGALQAQDYPGAKWAIGLRLPEATNSTIEEAIAAGTIVRTWPMRGTLHFVAAEDVRWMLALLTPRIIANSARRYKQLELDVPIFKQAAALFAEALQGGQALTRPEMMALLEAAGIATGQQRGYHILGWAAQQGLICFGPTRGKKQTFVLLNEWIPKEKQLTPAEPLAELAQRYFTGHGPATLADFIWWSGLFTADARAGLEMVKAQLQEVRIDDQSYWLSANVDYTPVVAEVDSVYLLPGFDEYLLGYTDRSAVLAPPNSHVIQPGRNGMFKPTVVVNGRVAGIWQRTLKKNGVTVEISSFAPLSKSQLDGVAAAVARYGTFEEKETVVWSAAS